MANYVSKHTGAQIDAAVEKVPVIEQSVATLTEEIDRIKDEGGIGGGVTTTKHGSLVTIDCEKNGEISVEGETAESVTLVHCGKNLIPLLSNKTITSGNVTFVQDADGTITVNGTVGESDAWPDYIPRSNPIRLPAGTYTLNSDNTSLELKFTIAKASDKSAVVSSTHIRPNTVTLEEDTDVFMFFTVVKNATYESVKLHIQLEVGGDATGYEPPTRTVSSVTLPTVLSAHDGVNTIYTEPSSALRVTTRKTVGAIIDDAVTKKLVVDWAAYGLPMLYLTGDTTGMTKDDYVPLAFTFQGRSGTVQVKKQGTSSIGVGQEIGAGFDDDLGGLFNFTLKFPEAFEAKAGWGAHDKYCFKANAIDHSHLRNVGGAKLWGQIVRGRNNMCSAYWPNENKYGNKYSYSDGVYTASDYADRAGNFCCINGYTLPAGNYRIDMEYYIPSSDKNPVFTMAICDKNGLYAGTSLTAEATDEWMSIAYANDKFIYTGDTGYVSLQGKYTAGAKFRNVRFTNKNTGEVYPLGSPIWQLAQSPNAGAVDGFPCTIVLNGKYYMTGTFNIPKEGWMAGMGDGSHEAILCAEGTDNCYMTGTASVGTDYELEYVSDEDNAGWVQTSLNALINAVATSDGTDLDTTIAQRLDWDSAIDMMIFLALIGGFDLKKKNYLLVTYDGKKWMMGAYDMDSIWGNWWTGLEFFSSTNDMTSIEKLTQHRLYYLIRHHKLDAFKARYAELRAGVLSESNVEWTLTNFAAGMPSALLDANTKRWPRLRSTNANNLAQILNWFRLRCQAIDAEVAALT